MRFLPFLLVTAALAGCGSLPSINLWPFGGEPARTDIDRKPANATEYRCDNNRRFFVRPLEDGAIWLIAPDREVRLARLNESGRYGVGRVLLELHGDEASLTDPPGAFIGCRKAPV